MKSILLNDPVCTVLQTGSVTVTKNQSVNTVQTKVTVCLEIHVQHKCTVGRTHNFLMLDLDVHKVTGRL